MQYEDICTKKTYIKDGQEKVIWLKCGTLRTNNDGNKFIELNHLPNITFYVFAQKDRNDEQF